LIRNCVNQKLRQSEAEPIRLARQRGHRHELPASGLTTGGKSDAHQQGMLSFKPQ
jgi:hypothetical protein